MKTTTLSAYLEDLAASKPTPGGGSAVGLVAAQGVSLLAMVGRISSLSETIVTQLDTHRSAFVQLMADDEAAFDEVMRAMKLARDTDALKAARQLALQQALQQAASVPMQGLARLVDVLELAKEVADAAKASVLSDVGIAAELLQAAAHSTHYTVVINLNYLDDAAFVDDMHQQLKAMTTQVSQACDELIKNVRDSLSK